MTEIQPSGPSAPQIAEQVRAVGVGEGDVVMLHASLRKLGLARSQGVEGGAEILLDGLEAAVGPSGTLIMVLGTEYPEDWVNQHPIAERARLLEGKPPFDYLSAPVLPEVGYVAEAFRRRPGTLVSRNPSGRFGARGARADELLRDQPWNDYYGPGSPLEKLCALDGRVLRLGAGHDTVTVLHYAEYLAAMPRKRRTRWDYVLPEGHVFIECLDDLNGIADFDGDDYFAVILGNYLTLGRHHEGPVAAATAELLRATDIVDFGARWMEANLAP